MNPTSEEIKINYSVKGDDFPIKFNVDPNPWISIADNGFTLVFNRPGLYHMIVDRSHIPTMFRNQLRLNIMDHAKHRIVAKGVKDKYLATLFIDESELATPSSQISAHMKAPFIPPFNGTLTIIPAPIFD